MSMRAWRSNSSRPWSLLIALACLAAQLALATATLWHHHDDADARHDDCSVCVAVSSDQTDGLALPAISAPPIQLIGYVAAPAPMDLVTRAPRHTFARGPPKA